MGQLIHMLGFVFARAATITARFIRLLAVVLVIAIAVMALAFFSVLTLYLYQRYGLPITLIFWAGTISLLVWPCAAPPVASPVIAESIMDRLRAKIRKSLGAKRIAFKLALILFVSWGIVTIAIVAFLKLFHLTIVMLPGIQNLMGMIR